jgi:hypothetical protein
MAAAPVAEPVESRPLFASPETIAPGSVTVPVWDEDQPVEVARPEYQPEYDDTSDSHLPAQTQTVATTPAPSTPVAATQKGHRLTVLGKLGLWLIGIAGIANVGFLIYDYNQGVTFPQASGASNYLHLLADNASIAFGSIVGQVVLGALALLFLLPRRAWWHPWVLFVLIVVAQLARGIRGDDPFGHSYWRDWHLFGDSATWVLSWLLLPLVMLVGLFMYAVGWRVGRPKTTDQV